MKTVITLLLILSTLFSYSQEIEEIKLPSPKLNTGEIIALNIAAIGLINAAVMDNRTNQPEQIRKAVTISIVCIGVAIPVAVISNYIKKRNANK